MTASALELATFETLEVVVGTATRWHAGTLELDADAMTSVADAEPALARLQVDVVRRDEPARVVDALDAVEPQVKAGDPDSTFPGALGRLVVAGSGRTNRLDGVAVVVAGSFSPSEEIEARDVQESLVDLAGPGAPFCAWLPATLVVLTFEKADHASLRDVDAAIRRTALSVARDLAATTIGEDPSTVETVAAGSVRKGDLPGVCAIVQLGSEGPLYDTYLYGASVGGMLPTLLEPAELLDGAITAGAYHWAALRNPTYAYQRSTLVRELLDAHGTLVCFTGVVVTRGYFMSAEDKWRSALLAAKLARQTGADGAVITTMGGGNSHTDTMLTCLACEQLGVRTVAIVAEMGGLTDHVPEADAIVSTGNAEELVSEWEPRRVLGGAAAASAPVPLRNYLGATCQLGQWRVRAVTW